MTCITRRFRPLWMDRRWQRRGDSFFGWYRVSPFGAWQGRIVKRHATKWSYYIYSPPEEVLSGPHGPCFIRKGDDVYEVHFSRRGRSVVDGIVGIELTLRQAFEG